MSFIRDLIVALGLVGAVASVAPSDAQAFYRYVGYGTCTATAPCGFGRLPATCTVFSGYDAWGRPLPCESITYFGAVTCTGVNNFGYWGSWSFSCF